MEQAVALRFGFKQIKSYREHFNLLLVDLRGHGKSNQFIKDIISHTYTFKEVTKDVVKVLDHLKISSAHFVGMSLGTIIVRTLAELETQRVRSMVLGGAVTRLNARSQVLVKVGDWSKKLRALYVVVQPFRLYRDATA